MFRYLLAALLLTVAAQAHEVDGTRNAVSAVFNVKK